MKHHGKPLPRGGRIGRIVLCVLGVLLALCLFLGLLGAHRLHQWSSGQWSPTPQQKESMLRLARLSGAVRSGEALLDDLQDLSEGLKAQDADSASQARERMQADLKTTRRRLNSPFWRLARILPGAGKPLKAANELLGILQDADESLIGPYLTHMRSYPITEMTRGESVNAEALGYTLDFLEEILPDAERLAARLRAVDLGVLDRDGSISARTERLGSLLEDDAQIREVLAALRVVLGDGQDRLYLFAAQNSSELRASGGFPGSVGTIRIQDGWLSISDFESVYHVLARNTPYRAEISPVEDRLFSGRMHLSWDADFSPDFERVASIWAMAYEERNHEAVDGVLSGTPVIIQRLLSFLGSIRLSDGTVLNGKNASRVLGHDLYFQYLGPISRATQPNTWMSCLPRVPGKPWNCCSPGWRFLCWIRISAFSGTASQTAAS